MKLSLEERGRLIEAMRAAAREQVSYLSELAHTETGYGKVADKMKKNLLAINKTPGIEDLHTSAMSGDFGLRSWSARRLASSVRLRPRQPDLQRNQ